MKAAIYESFHEKLVCQPIDLEGAASALGNLAEPQLAGVTVTDRFCSASNIP